MAPVTFPVDLMVRRPRQEGWQLIASRGVFAAEKRYSKDSNTKLSGSKEGERQGEAAS